MFSAPSTTRTSSVPSPSASAAACHRRDTGGVRADGASLGHGGKVVRPAFPSNAEPWGAAEPVGGGPSAVPPEKPPATMDDGNCPTAYWTAGWNVPSPLP